MTRRKPNSVIHHEIIAADMAAMEVTSSRVSVDGEHRSFSQAEKDFFTSIRLRLGSDPLISPYSQLAWVYACVHALASNISGLPFQVRSASRVESEETFNSLSRLFENPNPLMSMEDFFYFTVMWLSLSGEVVFVKQGKSSSGRVCNITEVPTELWPLNGRLFTKRVNKKTRLIEYYVLNEGTAQEQKYEPHEVLFLRYPHPDSLYRGLPPMEAAAAATTQDWLAYKYNRALLENGGDPGGVILFPEKVALTERIKQNTIKQFEDRHGSPSKAGRVGVLDRGARYESFKQTLRDMEHLNTRRWNREEIMAVFRTPPSIVGVYEQVNFATAKQEAADFWAKTLVPIVRRIQGTLYHGLFKNVVGGRFTGVFDLSGVVELQADFAEQMDVARQMADLGWTAEQINERLKLGLPINEWQKTAWLDMSRSPVETMTSSAAEETGDGESEPTTGEPVQATALNGAQISSLLEILFQVQAGSLNPDSAKQALAVAFPMLTPAQIDGMIDPIKETLSEEGPKPVPESPEVETVEEATPPPPLSPPPEKALQRQESPEEAKARRTQYWETEVRGFQDKEVKRFAGMLGRYFLSLRKEVLTNLSANYESVKALLSAAGDDVTTRAQVDELLFDLKKWGRTITSSTTPHYKKITTEAAKRLAKEVGDKIGLSPNSPELKKLLTSLGSRVTRVNSTIRETLRKALKAGIDKEETLTQLQKRVKQVFNTSNSRALRIARTEVGSAADRARYAAMRSAGVKEHEWVSSRDDFVRDSHEHTDGEIVEVGEEFSNGLKYPHDPDGPAEEVINCRCLASPKADPDSLFEEED